jgi:hypothetical protein
VYDDTISNYLETSIRVVKNNIDSNDTFLKNFITSDNSSFETPKNGGKGNTIIDNNINIKNSNNNFSTMSLLLLGSIAVIGTIAFIYYYYYSGGDPSDGSSSNSNNDVSSSVLAKPIVYNSPVLKSLNSSTADNTSMQLNEFNECNMPDQALVVVDTITNIKILKVGSGVLIATKISLVLADSCFDQISPVMRLEFIKGMTREDFDYFAKLNYEEKLKF